MCGIAAIISREPSVDLAENIERMTSIISHRGPDDEGFLLGDFRTGQIQVASGDASIESIASSYKNIKFYYRKPYCLGFGHRRLSIIDPSPLGHQPMTSKYEHNWITFNGEIYIFKELRAYLEKQGYHFVSKSDTEVLLNCYHRFATEVTKYLNGIFSFVIWDVNKQKIFIGRDHFGVKPLYYYLDSSQFIVASEIKAILQVKGISRILDVDSLDDYLTFRYTPSPNTLLSGIKKLRPGHDLSFDPLHWNIKIRRYYNNIPRIINNRPIKEWAKNYSETLIKAIRRQMVSDVPIGALLSGGIDSSLVTAIASSLTSRPLKTFTVGFEEDYLGNEFKEAKKIASLFNTDHNEVVINSKDYLNFFSDAAWFMDEPVGSSSSIAMYYLCKWASKEVKTVLTGQGADEPLAGYARYKAEKFVKVLSPILSNEIVQELIERLPRNEQLKRAVRSLGEKNWKNRFLLIYALFNNYQKNKLLNSEFKAQRNKNRSTKYLEYWVNGLDNLQHLNKMLYIDTRMSLADDLLNYGDKMSMATSLEARVPMLDIEHIDLIESMPINLKIRGWKHSKFIHKLVAKNWLPKDILNKPKKGFPTPVDQWFQKELSGEISDILLSSKSFCYRYFSIPYIRFLIESHISRKEDYHRHLFALLFFELWARRFLN